MIVNIPPIRPLPYKLILASASPRRRELLSSLGFEYESRPVNADESQWPESLKEQEIALYLAVLKARAYPQALHAGELLITADTIVWCGGRIFNKPGSFEEGRQMLRSLSGKMHQVFTAVCLKSAAREISFYEESRVYFKELSDEEIDYYLQNYKPFDKAGGYGVQDWIGYIAIEKIEGSFYNVMGLPVKMLYEQLYAF